ncbi:MAG: DUF1287 domain-containing protein [Alteromonadales bacterium]|nr:DUF1287 domain-containing protein [Alteromonadales bacterium]
MKNTVRFFAHCYLLILLVSHGVSAASFEKQLAQAALQRTDFDVMYNGSYVNITYPNGDVPANTGVCTDVIIRSYRALGIDLQKLVHEDMRDNFLLYPSKRIWGLKSPDSNIDHRRVPNLKTYFQRFATSVAITANPIDYKIGDIVTWMLPGNFPHIGIVAEEALDTTSAPRIVHNIGLGPQLEDMLFDYTITGHYRFTPKLN